jgi:hypothetical protein
MFGQRSSWARVFQFGTFNFCISFLTSPTQRVFGLPIGLLEMGFQEYIAYTILVPCIYPYRHSPSTILMCCVFLMWHVSAHIHEAIIRPINDFIYISRNIFH